MRWVIVFAIFAGSCGAFGAETRGLDVKSMNFDLWCQEQAKLPPARCEKRLPADENAFNSFRKKIEGYEIPYLQEKKRREQTEQDLMHNGPAQPPAVQTSR